MVCDKGNFNVLKLLMRVGVKIDVNYRDEIIFNFLCYWNYLNIIKKLIEMEFYVGFNNKNEVFFIVVCEFG